MQRPSPALVVLLLAASMLPAGHAQFQPDAPPEMSPYTPRTEVAEAAPDLAGALRVLRFVQVSDAHILDDDAPYPLRQEPLDAIGPPVEGAQRPQEEYTDEVLDAIIREVNRLHGADALDFVLNTGDNIDNALENELMRFLDNWEGTVTTEGPISGLPCAPDGRSTSVEDNENDVTDQCTHLPDALAANNTPLADGLPWFSAFGNHDGLVQGNAPLEPSFQETAGQYGRYFLQQHEYVAMHFGAGAQCVADLPAGQAEDDMGHGYGYAGARLCDDDPDNDGYYHFDLRGVRFVVLDTVNDDFVTGNENLQGEFNPQATIGNDLIGGYAEGAVDPAQFQWLEDLLAASTNKLVVLASHHTVNSMFSDVHDVQCAPAGCLHDLLSAAGYKTHDDLLALLSQYPNVAAWVGGHTHQNRIQAKQVEGAPSPGFWNVETASLIDLPQEARTIELWAVPGGKAFLLVDPFTHDFDASRALAQSDDQGSADAAGGAGDRSAVLWLDLPDNVKLEPQPSLPRFLDLRRVGPDDPVPAGEATTLVVQARDAITRTPLAGLVATVEIGYPGSGVDPTFTYVVEPGTVMTDTGDGDYSVPFTPPVGGTYFALTAFTDPAERYPERGQQFSVAVAGDEAGDDAKSTAGAGAAALLVAVAALAVWRRRR